jgi:hypothetical protein
MKLTHISHWKKKTFFKSCLNKINRIFLTIKRYYKKNQKPAVEILLYVKPIKQIRYCNHTGLGGPSQTAALLFLFLLSLARLPLSAAAALLGIKANSLRCLMPRWQIICLGRPW